MFAHFSFATLWGAEPGTLKFTSFQSIPQARPEWRGLKERNACVDTIQSNPAGLPSGSLGFSLLHEGRHHALP
jgi:hypothetical protein